MRFQVPRLRLLSLGLAQLLWLLALWLFVGGSLYLAWWSTQGTPGGSRGTLPPAPHAANVSDLHDQLRRMELASLSQRDSSIQPFARHLLLAQSHGGALPQSLSEQDGSAPDYPEMRNQVAAMQATLDGMAPLLNQYGGVETSEEHQWMRHTLGLHLADVAAQLQATGLLIPEPAAWGNPVVALRTLVQQAPQQALLVVAVVLFLLSVFLVISIYRTVAEERLATRRFHLAASAARGAVYDWDVRGGTLVWTTSLTETFGHPLPDVPTSLAWWADQIHPNDLERVSGELDACVLAGRDFVCEYRFRHYDGRYLYVWDRGRVERDRSGQVIRMVGIMEDLSEYRRTAAALRQQSELYGALLQTQSDLGEGLAIIEAYQIRYANTALSTITGYTTEQLLSLPSLFDLMPHMEQRVQRVLWRRYWQHEPAPPVFETVFRHCTGHLVDVEMAVKEMTREGSRQFILICRDITARKGAQAALLASEQKYAELVRESPDAVLSLDANGVVETVNPAAGRMWGGDPNEAIGHRLTELDQLAPAFRPRLLNELELVRAGHERLPFELELVQANGKALVVEVNARLMARSDGTAAVQLTLRDISERKEIEAKLEHQAFHDPLTSLPNRALFRDRVEQALARARRQGRSIAVLFLDLDHFKVINDSLGHYVGDQLLFQVAQRLLSCVCSGATVARQGGDEFTILLEEVANVEQAIRMAEQVAEALGHPFGIEGRQLFVTTSIGIVLSQPHHTLDDLLRHADVAMYRAKEHGKAKYEVFDASMNARALERLEMESDLRDALEHGTLSLYYQPLVEYRPAEPPTYHIVGVEALLRWFHPRWGSVPPERFIRLAEETGLIEPLGHWVLTSACEQACKWSRLLPKGTSLELSVNLSPRQLHQPTLVADIARTLAESGWPAGCLKFELTESIFMGDLAGILVTLRHLKALGVKLAIDDFGTGWSSLSYLKRFPVDAVKIDRSFVSELNEDPTNRAIILAVMTLAETLGLQVTAEGVERAEQAALLHELGCTIAQGFYFARPLAAPDMERLIQNYTLRVSK